MNGLTSAQLFKSKKDQNMHVIQLNFVDPKI